MPPTSQHSHVILPFEARHLNGIQWIEEEHAKLFGMARALRQYARSPSFSAFCGGRFIAAAGIIVPWPGLGEAWAVAGPLVWTHKAFFHRTVKEYLFALAEQLKLRRLQAMVRAEYTGSHRWVQSLGFQRESTLCKYGIKGEDMTMYAMFLEEQ